MSLPAIDVTSKFLNPYCQSCYKPVQKDPFDCPRCLRVTFCSRECFAKNSYHDPACSRNNWIERDVQPVTQKEIIDLLKEACREGLIGQPAFEGARPFNNMILNSCANFSYLHVTRINQGHGLVMQKAISETFKKFTEFAERPSLWHLKPHRKELMHHMGHITAKDLVIDVEDEVLGNYEVMVVPRPVCEEEPFVHEAHDATGESEAKTTASQPPAKKAKS
jgi:hypothetical protein